MSNILGSFITVTIEDPEDAETLSISSNSDADGTYDITYSGSTILVLSHDELTTWVNELRRAFLA